MKNFLSLNIFILTLSISLYIITFAMEESPGPLNNIKKIPPTLKQTPGEKNKKRKFSDQQKVPKAVQVYNSRYNQVKKNQQKRYEKYKN